VLIANLATACVATPADPSVGALGAGFDAAYINASRADA
jgi:hypothetical protein